MEPYGKSTYKSSPHKPLDQLQPNFGGMVLGMAPSKDVSGDPDIQPTKFDSGGHLGRKAEPPDRFLGENHPMTISSKFSSY
jgi:hypothetical protein